MKDRRRTQGDVRAKAVDKKESSPEMQDTALPLTLNYCDHRESLRPRKDKLTGCGLSAYRKQNPSSGDKPESRKPPPVIKQTVNGEGL